MIDDARLLRFIQNAELWTSRRAMMVALYQSSGKFKAKRLAKLGHPYQERKQGIGVPYNDPGRINVQTGKFYLSWQVINPELKGDNLMSGITNISEYADELAEGIPGLTIKRPLLDRVVRSPAIRYWRIVELTKGIRDAIRSNP